MQIKIIPYIKMESGIMLDIEHYVITYNEDDYFEYSLYILKN